MRLYVLGILPYSGGPHCQEQQGSPLYMVLSRHPPLWYL